MCRKIESVTLFRIIKSIDSDALVTQANVNGVYGQGFDQIKVKMHAEPHHEDIGKKIDAATRADFGGHHASAHAGDDEVRPRLTPGLDPDEYREDAHSPEEDLRKYSGLGSPKM